MGQGYLPSIEERRRALGNSRKCLRLLGYLFPLGPLSFKNATILSRGAGLNP